MGETACLITIMFRMRRTELECRRGVLLLRPLCCRSLCRTYDSRHAARGCGNGADFCHEANCFAEDIVNSRIAGMNEHLTKPLNEKKLLEVIRKYLRNQRK